MKLNATHIVLSTLAISLIGAAASSNESLSSIFDGHSDSGSTKLVREGKHIFRFDTFGDEAF